MAEEKHHHHLFHHQKEEDEPVVEAVTYSETAYGGSGPYYESTEAVGYATVNKKTDEYEKEEKKHKHKEHLGEMGAAAAGAFALVTSSF